MQTIVPVFRFQLYRVLDPTQYDLGEQEQAWLVKGPVPRPTELMTPHGRAPLITHAQLADLLNDLQDRAAGGPVHYLDHDPDGLGQPVLVAELRGHAALDIGGDIVRPGPGVIPGR